MCGDEGMRIRGVANIGFMGTSCIDTREGVDYRGVDYRLQGVWTTGGVD